jgi:hypothetical protein
MVDLSEDRGLAAPVWSRETDALESLSTRRIGEIKIAEFELLKLGKDESSDLLDFRHGTRSVRHKELGGNSSGEECPDILFVFAGDRGLRGGLWPDAIGKALHERLPAELTAAGNLRGSEGPVPFEGFPCATPNSIKRCFPLTENQCLAEKGLTQICGDSSRVRLRGKSCATRSCSDACEKIA